MGYVITRKGACPRSTAFQPSSHFCRVLNFIDIDCGPDGRCPDHATKARSFPSFRSIFEAAWNKTTTNIRSKITDIGDVNDVREVLVQRCGNKTWPGAGQSSSHTKKALICKAAFFIHLLSKENPKKAEETEKILIKNLFDQSLFKELSQAELNNSIVSRIESLVGDRNVEMFAWDFENVAATKMAAKFFFELSAITYRVTKLGTLMAWSDSYHLVTDFFDTIMGRLEGAGQAEVSPNDLMKALSPESYNDAPVQEIEQAWQLDSKSNRCVSLPEQDHRNSCCRDNTACYQGSIRTVMRIMKDGMFHPHALEIDTRLENFSGNMSDGSYPLLPTSYLTEDLIGFKLIGPDSFLDKEKPHRHFLTPDPLIPFCKINDEW